MANRVSLVKNFFIFQNFKELYFNIFHNEILLKAYDEFKNDVELHFEGRMEEIYKKIGVEYNVEDTELKIFDLYFQELFKNIENTDMEMVKMDHFLKFLSMDYQYDILYSDYRKIYIILIFREDF